MIIKLAQFYLLTGAVAPLGCCNLPPCVNPRLKIYITVFDAYLVSFLLTPASFTFSFYVFESNDKDTNCFFLIKNWN